MGKYIGLEGLLIMTDILTNDGKNTISNIKNNKHANMSLEDDDSSDSATPSDDQGAGDAMDFGAGLDDIGGDMDDADPMGGGDDDFDMGGGDDDSGGDTSSMGGGTSGFNPIDQDKKDVSLSPHYVQDRRMVLFDLFVKLLDSVKDSKDLLTENNKSFAKNKPIIEALEELERDIQVIIESINKMSHDVLMLRLSECRAIYNNIKEKV